MEFRKHWDRWFWIVAVAGIAIVFFRLLYGREPFCGNADEHCLREWFSALAGWAALAVAVPSVIFLAKQVKDAEKFFRASAAIATLNEVNTAEHLLSMAKAASSVIAADQDELEKDTGVRPVESFTDLNGKLAYLSIVMSRQDFASVSQRYKIYTNAEDVVHVIGLFMKDVQTLPATPEGFREARKKALSGPYKLAAAFAKDLEQGCIAWLETSRKILDFERL